MLETSYYAHSAQEKIGNLFLTNMANLAKPFGQVGEMAADLLVIGRRKLPASGQLQN